LGDFIFSAVAFSGTADFGACSWCSHLQLTSVFSEDAVEGALSTSPFSRSEDEDSAVLVVLSEAAESEVDVRVSGVLPLRGGDASEMFFRKSM
jgi:hypothetical protein